MVKISEVFKTSEIWLSSEFHNLSLTLRLPLSYFDFAQ